MRPWLLLVPLLVSDLSLLGDGDWVMENYRRGLDKKLLLNGRMSPRGLEILQIQTEYDCMCIQRHCVYVAVQHKQRTSLFYWVYIVNDEHGCRLSHEEFPGIIHWNHIPALVWVFQSKICRYFISAHNPQDGFPLCCIPCRCTEVWSQLLHLYFIFSIINLLFIFISSQFLCSVASKRAHELSASLVEVGLTQGSQASSNHTGKRRKMIISQTATNIIISHSCWLEYLTRSVFLHLWRERLISNWSFWLRKRNFTPHALRQKILRRLGNLTIQLKSH